MPAWPPAAWAEEIERLRAEPAEGHIAIGGSTLAAEAAALGLIDEYRARVYPVLVGGGIPFFPSASAGWISNSSRPAPSARESSTSATAWRASRLVLRYLLACSAHAPVTGSVVARTFLQASNAHGLPAPALHRSTPGQAYRALPKAGPGGASRIHRDRGVPPSALRCRIESFI